MIVDERTPKFSNFICWSASSRLVEEDVDDDDDDNDEDDEQNLAWFVKCEMGDNTGIGGDDEELNVVDEEAILWGVFPSESGRELVSFRLSTFAWCWEMVKTEELELLLIVSQWFGLLMFFNIGVGAEEQDEVTTTPRVV